MTNLSEADDISIVPEEWAAMLRDAGAPEPWVDPAAAQRFAAGIAFRWPEAPKRKRGTFDRASEAIAELRRVLPIIIADNERLLAELNNPPPEFKRLAVVTAREQVDRELVDLRRLLGALPELRWELRKPPMRPWQLDAVRLYTLYLQHVDPKAGISADGPLVRFIVSALNRMRSLKVEHGTVAKALQRLRNSKERHRGPDKSGMV